MSFFDGNNNKKHHKNDAIKNRVEQMKRDKDQIRNPWEASKIQDFDKKLGAVINEVTAETATTEDIKKEEVKPAEEVKKEEVLKKEEQPKEEIKTDNKVVTMPSVEEARKKAEEAVKKAEEDHNKKVTETPKKVTSDEIKNAPKKEKPQPELHPKAWQTILERDGKKSLQNQIVFDGERVNYEVGLRHKYRFPNLDASDGLNRIVTAKYPKSDEPDSTEDIDYMGYHLILEKYGSSVVCELREIGPDGIDTKTIAKWVSLATILDILQDRLNTGETCDISWGLIDQSIKYKRGLKSRIKNLDEKDMPVSSRGKKSADANAKKDDAKQELPGFDKNADTSSTGTPQQKAAIAKTEENKADVTPVENK